MPKQNIGKNLFGERLRFLRLQAGLTQATLGIRAGYDQSTIHRFEAGKRIPALSEVFALVEALGNLLSPSPDSDSLTRTRRKLFNDLGAALGLPTGMLYGWDEKTQELFEVHKAVLERIYSEFTTGSRSPTPTDTFISGVTFDPVRTKDSQHTSTLRPGALLEEALAKLWYDPDEALDLLLLAGVLERARIGAYVIPVDSEVLMTLLRLKDALIAIGNAAGSYDLKACASAVGDNRILQTIVQESLKPHNLERLEQLLAELRETFAPRSATVPLIADEDRPLYDWGGPIGVVLVRFDVKAALEMFFGLATVGPDESDYFAECRFFLESLAARAWNRQNDGQKLGKAFTIALRLLGISYVAEAVSSLEQGPGEFFLSFADRNNRLYNWSDELTRSSRWLTALKALRDYHLVRNSYPLPRTANEVSLALGNYCRHVRELNLINYP